MIEALREVGGLLAFGMTLVTFLNGANPLLGLISLAVTAWLWRLRILPWN